MTKIRESLAKLGCAFLISADHEVLDPRVWYLSVRFGFWAKDLVEPSPC